MFAVIVFVHVIVCVLLISVILMQSGRGGGLTDGFAAAESMFGAKTTSFMVKTTTILASLFLITCLSIAVISSKKDESLVVRAQSSQTSEEEVFTLPLTNTVAGGDVNQ